MAMGAAKQLNQLKATVKDLKNRLVQEARRRQIDAKVIAAAGTARRAVDQQVTKLRAEGRKLAGDLKATLNKVKSHERAWRDAQSQIKALNAQLKRKDQELASQRTEIGRLSQELAARPPAAPAPAPAADESRFQEPLFPSEPSGWDPSSGEDSD
ncbi:MAG TPA: hypothetical protein VMV15_00300 [Candidatus Binataceae bacterium]|nr:hypothetical protein [Candidatus Binataceae bacterium]